MIFEEVDYWDELVEIMEWSKTHVTCTFFTSAGAHRRGYIITTASKSEILDQKDLWCLQAQGAKPQDPIGTRFDDYFMAPHSRHTRMDEDAIRNNPGSDRAGRVGRSRHLLILSKDNSQIFCMGHPEYDRLTLDKEYKRDLEKAWISRCRSIIILMMM